MIASCTGRTAATRDRQKEALATSAEHALAELPQVAPAPGLVELQLKSGGAPLLLPQRPPHPKTPPGRRELLAHWKQERQRNRLPPLQHNYWCESVAEVLAYQHCLQYFDGRRQQAITSSHRDDDAEWACAHCQEELQTAQRYLKLRRPPQADQISEQIVTRLAAWPGPPWLANDIGLQLLPPQFGIEAIVVMTRIAARR